MIRARAWVWVDIDIESVAVGKYHLAMAHMGSLMYEDGETRKKVILIVSLHAHPFLFISHTLACLLSRGLSRLFSLQPSTCTPVFLLVIPFQFLMYKSTWFLPIIFHASKSDTKC